MNTLIASKYDASKGFHLPARRISDGLTIEALSAIGIVPLGETTADLPDRERVAALPEYVHDRALEVAKTVHEATVPGAHADEPTVGRAPIVCVSR